MKGDAVIRPAVLADVPAIAKLAVQLVGYHRALDPLRFMKIDRVEEGYGWFLKEELDNTSAVLLVAVLADGRIVGYAYGSLEPRDWNALLDPHGALHDILVDPSARRQGLAEKLVLAMCETLEAMGAPRVLLHTATQNEQGQALFTKLGFRKTMVEMTREAGGGK